MLEIPKDEIQYWNVVQMTAENEDSILVGIVHDTELDHKTKDFRATPLHEFVK